ncbi:meiotically up-regulated gene 113-domain-containing protein [Coniochaeta sp. 2T2.1]|nr:meiotically up-regulated gene 113-domain-containing protein [Coniochaeta sp. 2T2.1]
MATPSPARSAAWPTAIDDLAGLLQVSREKPIKCHGYSERKPTCNWDISADSAQQITVVLRKIVNEGRLNTDTEGLLEDLSALVLCERRHQWQANEKYTAWITRARGLRPAPTAKGDSGSPPSPPGTPAPSGLGGRRLGAPVTPPSTPPSQRPRRSFSTATAGKPIPVNTQLLPPQSTPSRPTGGRPATLSTPPTLRSSGAPVTPTPSRPPLTQHTFAPYIKARSLVQINTDIHDLLAARLDPKETGRKGWVYGFRFPGTHSIKALPKPHSDPNSRDAVTKKPSEYVKIGYTANWETRKAYIESQCGYAPELLFRIKTRHYQLVESLLHLELDAARRRETVPCPSCGVRHEEWFEVDVGTARRKVEAWRNWAAQEPFEGRKLSEGWMKKLSVVKLEAAGEWERFREQ